MLLKMQTGRVESESFIMNQGIEDRGGADPFGTRLGITDRKTLPFCPFDVLTIIYPMFSSDA